MPQCYYLWGNSGEGKTKRAMELRGNLPYFKLGGLPSKLPPLKEVAILDDLTRQQLVWAAAKIKNMADRYKTEYEIKYGGFIGWIFVMVIITSNDSPYDEKGELPFPGFERSA